MKPTILIAEDRETISSILVDELTRMGWDVTLARDGESAWVLWQIGKFDWLSTDFDMPGLNGLQLARLVLGMGKAHITMLSSSEEVRDEFESLGGIFFCKSDMIKYLKAMKSILAGLESELEIEGQE